jgi:hypothetical protein
VDGGGGVSTLERAAGWGFAPVAWVMDRALSVEDPVLQTAAFIVMLPAFFACGVWWMLVINIAAAGCLVAAPFILVARATRAAWWKAHD